MRGKRDPVRWRDVDEIRFAQSELPNHLFDELRAGSIGRREFVRRALALGLATPTVAMLVSACGDGPTATRSPSDPRLLRIERRPGGTVRTGVIAPAGEIDPLVVYDEGGAAVLGQTAEYLIRTDDQLNLRPRLAAGWRSNDKGDVWTFRIRSGVTFHDGRALTARDVAASFQRLADPEVGSNALSVFQGVLSKDGVRVVDGSHVEFRLEGPNGNFPYLVSSDNYNAVVLPERFSGKWEKSFIGTGPWRLERYVPQVGVSYVRNDSYWDVRGRANADRSELTFYANEQAQVLGLQGGEVDVVGHYSVTGGKALLYDPSVRTLEAPSSAHYQLHMRNDREPFTDPRVRQAVALLVDRRELVDGLLDGKADVGNDGPFAPVFESRARSVPQRRRDVERARALLAEAGKPSGFAVELDTYDQFAIPDLAQIVQDNLRAGGIEVKLRITDAASYFGDGTFGKSRWLDSPFGITDYGHRSVPNVLLGAPLESGGAWNAAHFRNPRYDDLVKAYAAEVDLQAQRRVARKLEELLLEETPLVIPFFFRWLTATRDVVGVAPAANGNLDLAAAGFEEDTA